MSDCTVMQRATFCMTVHDMSLQHLGLREGDLLLCDDETESARFVLADFQDGLAHVCRYTQDDLLYDEANKGLAPDDAVTFGRVLGFARSLVPEDQEEATAK